jgi:hypothetical protein
MALRKAREKAKATRDKHGPDSEQYKEAIKKCVAAQHVLDRWDALNS